MKRAGHFTILMIGGAKRVSMARMMADACRRLGLEPHLLSYELTKQLPIASVATVVRGLRFADHGILTHLHGTVTEHGVDMIVPFVDPAVAIAARYRDTYGDVWVPTGDEAVAAQMFDKVSADIAFCHEGFPLPRLLNPDSPQFPIIAKPRRGSASQGIVVINSAADFALLPQPLGNYLMQEYIVSREEYTVDCYVNMAGEPLIVSPRLRGEVTGGEVSSTVTVDYPEIVTLTKRVLRTMKLRGAVTVQFLRDLDTGRLMVMEVNPRLGGGAVATVHAGADIPLAMIAEAAGMPCPPPESPRPGTLITRYPQEVVFYDQN